MKKRFFFLSFILFNSTYAQVISTIAGTGVAGYNGNGGPALSAQLNEPHGLAVDIAGNIYIAEVQNQRIRKITPNGNIITIAGTGTAGFSGDGDSATLAQLHDPFDIKADGKGNLYFCDGSNHRIRKIDSTGIITTVAGTGTMGFSGDNGLALNANLNSPAGLAFDTSGNIVFGTHGNHVRKINMTTGIITTIAGTGVGGYSGDGGLATAAQLWIPNYIYIDAFNNIYISDNQNQRIRKINNAGIISTFAGNGLSGFSGDGGLATSASLAYPGGMTMDVAGNAYIADYFNNRIRKVTPAGIITTIAGNGTAGFSGDGGLPTLASLNKVADVEIDVSGNPVICDYLNHRIRTILSNWPPYFITNPPNNLSTICTGTSVALDSMLAVFDSSQLQTETWSIVTAPSHGVLSGFPATALSNGTVVMPAGTSYTGNAGYGGVDSFTIKVSDGIVADFITFYLTSVSYPDPGIISGIDSVCPGATVTLSETVSNGIWSTSNSGISIANSLGVVLGISPGFDTVIYTVTNACKSSSAIFPFKVRSHQDCGTALPHFTNSVEMAIRIFPNPSQGEFDVEITGINEPLQITITDVLGRPVRAIIIKDDQTVRISLDVPAGIYLITTRMAGKQWSEKILVSQ